MDEFHILRLAQEAKNREKSYLHNGMSHNSKFAWAGLASNADTVNN